MGSATSVNEQQGVLQPQITVADLLYSEQGVVRVESLRWPNFDPERVTTMAEYIGEIGVRMAETPRESRSTDQALHVYGADFERASQKNLGKGLYFPPQRPGQEPKKLVVRVTGEATLDRQTYPGVLDEKRRLAVSEELYGDIVQNAAFYADRIAARTERANLSNGNVEERENLSGESVFYALSNAHERLEEWDENLLDQRRVLLAVYESLRPDAAAKRIKNLEAYRLGANMAIQQMVRVACRGLDYGTNETQNTLNAVTSNMYRSGNEAGVFRHYARMAIYYNDAMRGKINQSINGLMEQMRKHAKFVINNIDREYQDKKA